MVLGKDYSLKKGPKGPKGLQGPKGQSIYFCPFSPFGPFCYLSESVTIFLASSMMRRKCSFP